MERVRLRQVVIRAVKKVFLVALVMEHAELRPIEEPAALQPVRGDEIPPLLAPIRKVESDVGGAKASIGSRDAARRFRHPEARFGRYFDHQAGLVIDNGRGPT